MLTKTVARLLALGMMLALIAAACGSAGSDEGAQTIAENTTADPEPDSAETVDPETDVAETTTADSEPNTNEVETADPEPDTAATTEVDLDLFFDGALANEVATESCTLSGGAETQCYTITVAGNPVTYDTGPFCPTSITDTAEAGGIWFDGDGVYELDGQFFTTLAELYNDDNWLMYDEDGNIFRTETAEEFDLAARPDVDPSLQNHCVEGQLDWLENGEAIPSTLQIPVAPVLADTSVTTRGNLGVTLDGIVIAASAPVDAILSAYTIAAFDDCGGHYNPNDGYHLHGATGCSEVGDSSDDETAMFAYAMDGFPVHSPLADAAAANLDECNGHDIGDGYHYHANNAAENLVIQCLIGQTVVGAAEDGGRPERPDGPPPGDEEG